MDQSKLSSLPSSLPPSLSWQEARSIQFIGDRLADKVAEIISSGSLRRLDHVDKEKQSIIALFKHIHGVGQSTAEQFYAQVPSFALLSAITLLSTPPSSPPLPGLPYTG